MADNHSHQGNESHGHSHDHAGPGHGHVHLPASFGRAFAIGIALNVGFVATEVVAGFWANSVALLADAGHNLGDVLGLILAWAAIRLSERRPNARYSYGLGASSILAALANGLLLMLATGAIAWEAVQRLVTPEEVASPLVAVVAGLGILINGATAWGFARGRRQDMNIRGAFLHMTADAAVSAGVVLTALAIPLTGWLWLDPLASLVIAAVIIGTTWGLLAEASRMALGATPAGIDPGAVRAHLLARPGVQGLHDLHVWPISTTQTALTCHLVMPEPPERDAFLHDLAESLKSAFGIGHATVQIETTPDGGCHLAPDEVV
jgi:cobalt-zinc-cadmium efflux system protein